jgi:hypothetical protein
MARRKSLRSQLYRAARDLGNIEAAEKGPSYGKRVVRRKAYRKTNSITPEHPEGIRTEQVAGIVVLYPAISCVPGR